MSSVLLAGEARKNLFRLIDEVAKSHRPKFIRGKRNTVVMISEQDWYSIEEILQLSHIPTVINKIKEAQKAYNKKN